MSWMLICGNIYHCLNCHSTFHINFEGDPLPTQIGDLKIFEQMELNKKYNQLNSYPDEEGYYLHIEGYCQNCYKKIINNNISEYESICKIFNLRNNLYETRNALNDNLEKISEESFNKWIENLSLDFCKVIDEKLYNYTIGHKEFNVKNLRKKIIQKFVDNSRSRIIDICKNEVGKILDEKNKNLIENFKSKDKQLIEQINFELGNLKTKKKIKYLLKKYVTYFDEINIYQTENLNDYISYEMTAKTPINELKKNRSNFYLVYKINLNDLNNLLNSNFEFTQIQIYEPDIYKKFGNKINEIAEKL